MTRTLPLAILCAMSGALVGALVVWLLMTATGAQSFGTGGWSVSPAERDANVAPRSAGLRPPVPFGAVADDRAGSGGGSPSLSAPVQLDDGGGVSSAMEGWATFCRPTPTRCQSWGNEAMVGAVPSFRYGDTPYRVTVWSGRRRTSVLVVSFCACGDRAGRPTVIDLSPAAFDDLAPLSAGVIPAVVVSGGGPGMTLPPTSTEAMP